eukprot:scaffold52297_cov63-Phaeocystis_antarctica.AAC.6
MMIVVSTVYRWLNNRRHRSDCVRFQSLLFNADSSAVASTASEVSSRMWPGVVDIRQTMLVYVKSNLRPRACHSSGRPSKGFVSDAVDDHVPTAGARSGTADSLDLRSGGAWLVGGGASPLSSSRSRIRGTVDIDDMACVERSRAALGAQDCDEKRASDGTNRHNDAGAAGVCVTGHRRGNEQIEKNGRYLRALEEQRYRRGRSLRRPG